MAAKEELDRERERWKRLRRVLLWAFGGLLALMLLAGLDSFRSLRQLDALERQANQRFAAHNNALLTLVISVHSYNNQIERFLMPGESTESSANADDVAQSGAVARAAVQRYPEDQDPEEQRLLRRITEELVEEQNSFVRVAAWRVEERSRNGARFLIAERIPHRTYIIQ